MIILNTDASKSKILFIHNPRTAGTSLLNVIRFNILDKPSWLYIGNPEEELKLINMSSIELGNYSFIGGHVSLNIFIKMLGNNFKHYFSFTVLRNPLDRAVSLYEYIKKTKVHYQYEIVQKMTFVDYVKSKYYPRNHQCHLSLANAGSTQAIDFLLTNITAVGIMDELNLVVRVLKDEFNVSSIFDMPHINSSRSIHSIDYYKEANDLIKNIDSDDMDLYYYFDKKISEENKVNQ